MALNTQVKAAGFAEFVALMALCMSLVALSIDTILPALTDIAQSYGVTRLNSQQFLISFLFAGLALGQLIAGPLSDSIGRKKAVYVGLLVFLFGTILSYCAPSYEMMLAGRFLQGVGAGGPRIVSVTIVRDRYEGREMARVMSYIMGVFIMLPAIAPTFGQGLMHVFNWQAIFLFLMVVCAMVFAWLSTRMEETLKPEDKRAFTVPVIWGGIKAVCANKMTLCYMIAAGLIFGAFLGYLNSAQQIFLGYYDTGKRFPQYFAMIVLALGAAFVLNARFVKKFGMRKLITWALMGMVSCASLFAGYEMLNPGPVPMAVFLIFIMAVCFCMGMLFGNFNALAMVPMGHMAGIASAVIGCVSLLIASIAGSIIGQMYNDTLLPVTCGFLVLGLISLGLMLLNEKIFNPVDD